MIIKKAKELPGLFLKKNMVIQQLEYAFSRNIRRSKLKVEIDQSIKQRTNHGRMFSTVQRNSENDHKGKTNEVDVYYLSENSKIYCSQKVFHHFVKMRYVICPI